MGSLNQAQRSILIGSLLGDGALRLAKGKLNALFEVNHTVGQKVYVDWKYDQLRKFVLSKPKERKGGIKRIAYRFTTRSLPVFTVLYREFYQKNKKRVPDNLSLNPLMLAVWFMDDGSKSRSSIYLNTQQFSVQDQKRLLKFLNDQYNFTGKLNKDKEYFRIRISTKSTVRFKDIIRPYVLPLFNYKLG